MCRVHWWDFVFIFLLSAESTCLTLNADYMSSVKDKIFVDYDKDIVPTVHERPVEVVISMYLTDMYPTVKTLMHYGINCYLRMKWLDYRLAYNRTKNETYIPFDYRFVQKIWTPNIYFPTLKQGTHHSLIQPNYAGFLYSNGTVLIVIRLSITSFCEMDLQFFPFDIQSCDFSIECYTYPNAYVVLDWEKGTRAIRRDHNLHSMDFQEVLIEQTVGSIYYPMFGEYSQLILRFKMYRHLSLYILSDFVPCIMIVILSWVSFWINYRSTPARVSFGITTILTSITMTNTVRGESIDIFRSLDYYTLMCNLFVFFALAEYALVGITEPNKRFLSRIDSPDFQNQLNCNNGRNGANPTGAWYRHHDKEASIVNVVRKLIESQQLNRETDVVEEEEEEERFTLKRNANHTDDVYVLNHQNHTSRRKRRKRKNKKSDTSHYSSSLLGLHSKEGHIVDRISRILFPTTFTLFNIIFFSYHILHPDTVDS